MLLAINDYHFSYLVMIIIILSYLVFLQVNNAAVAGTTIDPGAPKAES